MRRTWAGGAAILTLVSASLGAQPPVAANVATLLAFPTFFHDRQVILRGDLKGKGAWALLTSDASERGIAVFSRQPWADGPVEISAHFWDLGRLTADDPRLSGYDVKGFLDATQGGNWPGHGEVPILIATGFSSPASPAVPTIRALALDPLRYEGQRVTLHGQFRGRNLFGDLPRSPGIGRWEFVLRSGNGAIWVIGVQPKGRGWQLDPDSRLDTNQWLEATGVVRQRNGLVWLEATDVTRTDAVPEKETPQVSTPPPPSPPPDVIFSLPTEGDTDIAPTTTVQIQVSRPLDEESLKGHVGVSYLGAAGAGTPPVGLEVTYNRGDRIIVIRFQKPLERFRTVKVELQDGITGVDGQPLKPWTLTFSIGG
jgi:hypothetical protein